jgi:predicted nucleic acid-binding protein
MATWVVDASVILKWLLADPEREPDTAQASALMEAIATGRESIVQPPHWLAEISAVLARLTPETAEDDVTRLRAMDWPIADDVEVWARAVRLSIVTRQHVFDTLYHAVALEHDSALLVTADDKYRQPAERIGRVVALQDWSMSP